MYSFGLYSLVCCNGTPDSTDLLTTWTCLRGFLCSMGVLIWMPITFPVTSALQTWLYPHFRIFPTLRLPHLRHIFASWDELCWVILSSRNLCHLSCHEFCHLTAILKSVASKVLFPRWGPIYSPNIIINSARSSVQSSRPFRRPRSLRVAVKLAVFQCSKCKISIL